MVFFVGVKNEYPKKSDVLGQRATGTHIKLHVTKLLNTSWTNTFRMHSKYIGFIFKFGINTKIKIIISQVADILFIIVTAAYLAHW